MRRFLQDKKRASALILGVAFIVAGASFAIPSLAWLAKAQTTAKLDGLEGEAHGSYFNGGDGSKGSPFQIDNARQLYYFNWLQDLGYFNSPNDGRTAIDQTYFVLTSDIDASGYTLPPAGTAEYPFVGSFDGGGKTISNLSISNSYAELTSPPVGAKSGSDGILSQAEVVGFFGVVGCTDSSGEVNGYKYDTSALEIKSLGISGASIKSSSSSTLAGLAAGYVNGTLSGVAVDDSSIEVKEGAKALTDIEGVKSISDYSLVGYATEGYRSSTEVRDETMSMPQIENPNTEHGSTNWGGSVDMKQMYNDLESERDDDTICEDVKYVSTATVDVDPDGKEYNFKVTGYSSTNAERVENGSYKYNFRNGERKDSEGKVLASYGLTTCSDLSDYVMIYGAPDTTATGSGNMTVTRNVYGYVTNISKDGNYLCLSSEGELTNGTDGSTATGWMLPGSGSSSYVFTSIDSTKYYLNISGTGSLSVSATASTIWTYDATNGSLYYSDGDAVYYVDYSDTDGWGVTTGETITTYLVIYDTEESQYIGVSGTSATHDSSYNGTAFRWAYDSSTKSYYSLSDNTKYLTIRYTSGGGQSQRSPTIYMTNQTGSSSSGGGYGQRQTTYYARMSLASPNSDGTGTGTISGTITRNDRTTTYYLYYSSGFSVNSSSSYADNFQVSQVSEGLKSIGLTLTKTTETALNTTDSVSRTNVYYTNPTYVPLAYSYDDEDNKSGINGVSKMNTGYLVGGANYIDSSDYAGDIRIAEWYTMSYLSTSFNSSYSNSNLQVLTRSCIKSSNDGTYSDSGWSTIKDNYNSSASKSSSISFSGSVASSALQRYDSARQNLSQTFFNSYDASASGSSSTTLYGIHFMDAEISIDHLSEVGKAIIYDKEAEAKYQAELKKYASGEIADKPTQEGSVYENYEVPEDSIDFNLATDGYINFFGGSYYTNNKSFFSLHQVIRYEDEAQSNYKKIKEIKEISKIYANTGDDKETIPYVYQYSDGTASGTIPSSSYLAFDTSWISSPSVINNCLYYFEIPVNSGEYALGSVKDSNGGYVLYLDIGTGAANPESVTITEKTVSTIIRQSYPKGVDFSSSPASMPSPAGGGSACVAILVAPSKKLEYDYEGSALKVTADSSLKAVYIGDGVTVSGESGEEIESAISDPVTITMERTTVETFSPTNSTLSKIYSCTWTISGASVDDAYQLYFPAESATWASGDESKGTVASGLVTVKGEGDFKVTAEGSEDGSASSDWQGPEPIVKTGVFGELKLSLSGGEASVEYVYDADSKTYVVTVHCDAAVTVTVLAIPSDASYKITVNGTEVTAVSQVIEVPVTA